MRKILRNQSILTQTSDLTYYKSEKYSFFCYVGFGNAYYKNGKHSCNKIKSYSRLKSSIIAHLYFICGLIKLKMLNLALFDSFKNQRHYFSSV